MSRLAHSSHLQTPEADWLLLSGSGEVLEETLEEHADPGPQEERLDERTVLGEELVPLLLHNDMAVVALKEQPVLDGPFLPRLLVLRLLSRGPDGPRRKRARCSAPRTQT